jgi:hypothetical protein
MRVRYPTLHSPVVVHGQTTTLATLQQAGLLRCHAATIATRDGYRMHYGVDYLPDCDEARGITEGWQVAPATYRALQRRALA